MAHAGHRTRRGWSNDPPSVSHCECSGIARTRSRDATVPVVVRRGGGRFHRGFSLATNASGKRKKYRGERFQQTHNTRMSANTRSRERYERTTIAALRECRSYSFLRVFFFVHETQPYRYGAAVVGFIVFTRQQSAWKTEKISQRTNPTDTHTHTHTRMAVNTRVYESGTNGRRSLCAAGGRELADARASRFGIGADRPQSLGGFSGRRLSRTGGGANYRYDAFGFRWFSSHGRFSARPESPSAGARSSRLLLLRPQGVRNQNQGHCRSDFLGVSHDRRSYSLLTVPYSWGEGFRMESPQRVETSNFKHFVIIVGGLYCKL